MDTSEEKYLKGGENRAIRYYFYLSNGLGILNEFRNLFLGIVAIYITLKLDNPFWMILMFVPCLIILTIVGYYVIHHVSKVKEWLSMKFGTHFGIKSFNYQQEQYNLLVEIRDLLKNETKRNL